MGGNETFVQVQPNSTGAQIDTFSFWSNANQAFGNYRQVVSYGDPVFLNNVASVSSSGQLYTFDTPTADTLPQVLAELKVISYLLANVFQVFEDLDNLRTMFASDDTLRNT